MEQIADSQLTFGSPPGARPTSRIFAGLIAEMLRPALNALSSPVALLAIQDAELTSPVTSLVVAALSQFLSEDVSRSIEKDLVETELQNSETQQPLQEALIQVDAPAESDSMLPLMPSLDHNALSEDKKKDKSPASNYHSSGFHDYYSEDEDLLLEPKTVEDEKQENPNIEEGVDLLIKLKVADAPLKDKTKDKPTDKKKPKSKRKQSSLPLQPHLSPDVADKPKSRRRTSPRRAEAMAKEAELARAEALMREGAVSKGGGHSQFKETSSLSKGCHSSRVTLW
jgi:hypothetical protein